MVIGLNWEKGDVMGVGSLGFVGHGGRSKHGLAYPFMWLETSLSKESAGGAFFLGGDLIDLSNVSFMGVLGCV